MYNIVAVFMRSRVRFSIFALFIYYIIRKNNNSDKLDPLYSEILTGNSYWTPSTGFLLDSYWIPTGLFVPHSTIPIP